MRRRLCQVLDPGIATLCAVTSASVLFAALCPGSLCHTDKAQEFGGFAVHILHTLSSAGLRVVSVCTDGAESYYQTDAACLGRTNALKALKAASVQFYKDLTVNLNRITL